MSDTDPASARRAVLASGAGRYADPWHPFPRTSARIAGILRDDGWDVRAIADPDSALASLERARLLVVNAGDPWRGSEAWRGADPRAAAGLGAAIDRGIGIIAVHSALASLRDYPAWRATIGGEWEEGTSWHPPIGQVVLPLIDREHPVADGLSEIAVFDELYTALVVDPGVRVLAEHARDAASHPLVWAREDPTRVVVTALGHDERAYDSPANRALLRNAARWAGRVESTRGGRMDTSPAHLFEE